MLELRTQAPGRSHDTGCADLRRLLDEVDQTLEAYCTGLDTARELDERLAALIVQMESDFSDQDLAMHQAGYAHRAGHVAQHRSALCAARGELRVWLQRRDSARLADYLRRDLRTWLAQHLHGDDAAFQGWLQRRQPEVRSCGVA